MQTGKKYITLQEAAAILGTSPITLRRLVREKRVQPEFMLGMNYAFLREKIEELAKTHHRVRWRFIV